MPLVPAVLARGGSTQLKTRERIVIPVMKDTVTAGGNANNGTAFLCSTCARSSMSLVRGGGRRGTKEWEREEGIQSVVRGYYEY